MAEVLNLDRKPIADTMKPLLNMVEPILMYRSMNPAWPNPPSIPSFGTILHGPIFRNLAMPKIADITDDEKVKPKLDFTLVLCY